MEKRADLLLVDASLGQRVALQRILTANGFLVRALAELRPVVATIAEQQFDHAVLDLRLPDRDGLNLVRAIRRLRPDARIAVVTDADSFATVVLALRAGADGFVPSPLTRTS